LEFLVARPEERASVEVVSGIVLQKQLTHAPMGTVGIN